MSAGAARERLLCGNAGELNGNASRPLHRAVPEQDRVGQAPCRNLRRSVGGHRRAAGIKYRSAVRGPVDMQVDTQHGGSIVYWNEPDGHQWEILTVSYARQHGRNPDI